MVVLAGSSMDVMSNPNWNATCSGCTDATANNYDASATVDDGSCTFDVPGCTDPTADNYDAASNVDDGSCAYSTSCAGSDITGLSASNIIHDRVCLLYTSPSPRDRG